MGFYGVFLGFLQGIQGHGKAGNFFRLSRGEECSSELCAGVYRDISMRSVFSSIWFALLPFPNKDGEKVDWGYQLIVNLIGSSLGGITAVLTVGALF